MDSCGGKGSGLQHLVRAGCAVPAFECLPVSVYTRVRGDDLPDPQTPLERVVERSTAVTSRLLHDASGEVLAWATRTLSALGPQIMVRSSATCEDLPNFSAAGIYLTVGPVSNVDDVMKAIAACWASLWSPLSWAVLRHHQSWPGAQGMGVVLQRYVTPLAAGIAMSRDFVDREGLRVEAIAGHARALVKGIADPTIKVIPRRGTTDDLCLGPDIRVSLADLRQQVLATEAYHAEVSGDLAAALEVEWVYDGKQIWLVQGRRVDAAPPPTFATRKMRWDWRHPEDAARTWHWDREHNPSPLSVAHASLVNRITDAIPGLHLTVQRGYLYEAADEGDTDVPTERVPAVSVSLSELREWLLARIASAPQTRDARVQLDDAVTLFIEFVERYGQATRSRVYRHRLRQFLLQTAHLDVEVVLPMLLAGGRRGLSDAGHDFANIAPEWDVASPTLGEQSGAVRNLLSQFVDDPSRAIHHSDTVAQNALAELRATLDADVFSQLSALVIAAQNERADSEDDDALFADALWQVRRALLAAADRFMEQDLLDAREDVFLLTLDEISSLLERSHAVKNLVHERQQKEHELQQWIPPLVIASEQPFWARPTSADTMLRGVGHGTLVQGVVRVVKQLGNLSTGDARHVVLVCPTLLPTVAMVLPKISALVTDHGGLLSHAALLAREFGVTAVVGTQHATSVLRDGDAVLVDGARGLVVRLNDRPQREER